MNRFTDYDPFAWIYNQDWGEEYHRQALSVLDQLVLHKLQPPACILDLCCGGGHVTAQLLERGYAVVGVEGSEEMLRHARERAPAATLLLADAREFTLPTPVQLAVSTFDSLNHIMSLPDLSRVFSCVKAALQPGSRFVFDMNREEAYLQTWSQTFGPVESDHACIARGTYDMNTRVAQCDVTVFRKQDTWKRADFRLLQHCHPVSDIYAALHHAGFTHVSAFDARTLGMTGATGFGRTFYVAC